MHIGDLRLGKVDGKQEFLERAISNEFYDTFLVPENVRLSDFHQGDRYFIYGFRGTGKTSLLRYFLRDHQPDIRYRSLVLFKSDVFEEDRIELSKSVGAQWAEADSGLMSLSQDYKAAWEWFVLHKLGEMIIENPSIVTDRSAASPFLRILGLGDEPLSFRKVIGFLPRLEGMNVRVQGNAGLIKGEFGLALRAEESAQVAFRDLLRRCNDHLKRLSFTSNVVIGFDELEAFHADEEKFRRDCMMVRDLLFVVDKFNNRPVANSSSIKLLAAVRSEMIQALGSQGQEIERTVHDRGASLVWHRSNRSIDHPLIEMLRRKLTASGVRSDADVSFEMFPRRVSGIPVDGYLFDGSFYKPRDIVWRVSLAQEAYPRELSFREHVFRQTEVTYSTKMWEEIAYELSGAYTDDEIFAIRRILAGSHRYFSLSQFRAHAEKQSSHATGVKRFLSHHSLEDLLHQLYRLGAVGNNYVLARRRRNRWVFRDEPDLFIDKKMEINRALKRALSLED